MTENEITEIVIGCAIKVHSRVGPGLLESAYEACLYHELMKTNLLVERQKALPMIYDEIKLDCGYPADFVIENKVVLEIKAVEGLNELHTAQVITYLKLTDCKVGLLVNFNVKVLKNGLKRIVNNYKYSA